MFRTLHNLRATIAIGATLVACGAMHSAYATDTTVQRVAMACTQGSDAAGCKSATAFVGQVALVQRAEVAAVKAPARPLQKSRVASIETDGSRFTYDSCGCSN